MTDIKDRKHVRVLMRRAIWVSLGVTVMWLAFMTVFLLQRRLPQALMMSVVATVFLSMGFHISIARRLLCRFGLLGEGGATERRRIKTFVMRTALGFFGSGALFLVLMVVCLEAGRDREGLLLMVPATACMLTAVGTFWVRALLFRLGLFEDGAEQG